MHEYEFIQQLNLPAGERLLTNYFTESMKILSNESPEDVVRIAILYFEEEFSVSLRSATRSELESYVENADPEEQPYILYSSHEWSEGWDWDASTTHLASYSEWRAWSSANSALLFSLVEDELFDTFSAMSCEWFRAICLRALSQSRELIVSSDKVGRDVVAYIQPHDASELQFKLDLAHTMGVGEALKLGF